jgi:hypothetical protein
VPFSGTTNWSMINMYESSCSNGKNVPQKYGRDYFGIRVLDEQEKDFLSV